MRITMETEPMNQLRIGTRCKTIHELVQVFRPYVDGNSIFVPSLGMQRRGLETVFVVQLSDGTVVMRGRCVVRTGWATADNPFGLPGFLLGLRTLTPHSKELFEHLRTISLEPAVPEVVDLSDQPTWIGPPMTTRPYPMVGNMNTIRPAAVVRPPAVVRSPPVVHRRAVWSIGAALGLLLLAVASGTMWPIAPSGVNPLQRPPPPRVETNATIEIDGTTYAVDLVLTPMSP